MLGHWQAKKPVSFLVNFMLYVNSMQIGYTVDPRSSLISPSWHSQHNHPKGFYFLWHVPYYFQPFMNSLVSLLPTFLVLENLRLHIQGFTKHLQNPQSSQQHMSSRQFYKNQFSDIRIYSFQKLSAQGLSRCPPPSATIFESSAHHYGNTPGPGFRSL